jgi:hypothetical protein
VDQYQPRLWLTHIRASPGGRSKQFFFEKKNQKTFVLIKLRLPHRAHQNGKVFAYFLKKKRFLAADGSVSTAPGIKCIEKIFRCERAIMPRRA